MAQGKVYSSPDAALSDVVDGSVVLVSGFAGAGIPRRLLTALADGGASGLTVVYCHGPDDRTVNGRGISELVAKGRVKKLISPMPFSPGFGGVIEDSWRADNLEIEAVPQGILVERLRAGGAGIGGVFLPTAAGSRYEMGRDKRTFAQGDAVLELPIRADYALVEVEAADTLGNAVYKATRRNWAPTMAMAARVTVAEAGRIVEPGDLDPEAVISPGIFVNRIVSAS